VTITYTPASNLRKENQMDIGEVGFFNEKLVKYDPITRDKPFLKEINKTREERKVNHEAEKEAYFKEIDNKKKKFAEEKVISYNYIYIET
jgi:hypothetical protein